jgi:hypothetical protein
MLPPEDRSRAVPAGDGPLVPVALPESLAAFLRADPQTYLALFHGADVGTLLIVKAPATEIDGLRGTVPIGVRHELYAHPAAPVVRTVVSFVDQPQNPLRLETFTNVDDPSQAEAMWTLAEQAELLILLYDERLAHRLSKRVPFAGEPLREVLDRAEELHAGIAPQEYDFDAAKTAVMEVTRLAGDDL